MVSSPRGALDAAAFTVELEAQRRKAQNGPESEAKQFHPMLIPVFERFQR